MGASDDKPCMWPIICRRPHLHNKVHPFLACHGRLFSTGGVAAFVFGLSPAALLYANRVDCSGQKLMVKLNHGTYTFTMGILPKPAGAVPACALPPAH